MTRISEDIASSTEDDMIDMQTRIGSYKQLQRRLNTEQPLESKEDLLNDLFGEYALDARSRSTYESLSGSATAKDIISEEEMRYELFESVGSNKDQMSKEEAKKVLK